MLFSLDIQHVIEHNIRNLYKNENKSKVTLARRSARHSGQHSKLIQKIGRAECRASGEWRAKLHASKTFKPYCFRISCECCAIDDVQKRRASKAFNCFVLKFQMLC